MIRPLLYLLIALPSLLLGNLHWSKEDPEGFSAAVSLSSDQLTTRSTITITIDLTYPSTHAANINQLRQVIRSADSPFHLKQENISEPIVDGNKTRQTASFVLQSWKLGVHPLNLQTVRFHSLKNENEPITFYPKVFAVTVKIPENRVVTQFSPTQLLPIDEQARVELSAENRRELIDDPERQRQEELRNQELYASHTFPWSPLLLIAAILIAVWGLQRLAKRWKRGFGEEAETTEPREKALKDLKALQMKQLPGKGMFETFYVELTLIVRRFIEDEHGIKAPEQSTEEFLYSLTNHSTFDKPTRDQLTQFLNQADLVKFAKHHPTVSDASDAQQEAQRFVVTAPKNDIA